MNYPAATESGEHISVARSRIALVLATVCLAAGCSSAAGTKSGAEPEPVTLVLANNDAGDDLDGAPAVAHFVDRLQQISGGRVVVDVRSAWKGGGNEPQILRDVAAGEADLAWSGTRALDLIGVTSLTPLHAPFLVGSYSAQRAVLGDPQVQRGMGDLADAGLTGLALLADELRMPVGVPKALLSPQDYDGAQFRTADSQIQSEGLTALGAVPTTAARFQDTMDGNETQWWTYVASGFYDIARFPTINTPLWPRSVVLVANPKRLDGLDRQVRGWIRTAAQDAAVWSREHARDREADELAKACQGGAKIATATPAQIEALKAKVQPVYQRLAEDPATADMFRRVEQSGDRCHGRQAGHDPAGVRVQGRRREPRPIRSTPLTAPGDPGDLPQGVYRYELTPEYLRSAGLPEDDVYGNAGIFTYTLEAGRWLLEQKPLYDNVINTTCEGFYDADGSTFTGSAATVTRSANARRGSGRPPGRSRTTFYGSPT